MQLAQSLRMAGLSVIQHMGDASFKSQMKKADGSGAAVALIIGENEVATAQVVIKPLRADAAQETVAAADVAAAVSRFKS
jgi:histidyl-tRNA synthetase